MNRYAALVLFTLVFTGLTLAAETPPAPDPKAEAAAKAIKEIERIASSLHYDQGAVALKDGLAKLNLPPEYRYLNPEDTEKLLTKIWGNPRGNHTLGMIVPARFDPLQGDSWAVVLSFSEDGYVKDDDAAKIDYNDLLKQMKEDVAKANEERKKEGYPAVELIGWAAPPRYDAATHKLYWAKELKFADQESHTLNYNIRMLGRRGVLVLNAVASMESLKQIEQASPALLGMVDFQEGHRYADFNDSTDKVATYGLAALVAGGIATKVGFFKALWLGILAFKKLIIVGAIALFGAIKRAWDSIRGRKPVEESALRAPTDPT